jgi:hypothetical protein
MELQPLFNIIVSVAGALCGWWLKVMWDSLRELRSIDQALSEKVSRIEVLVAGEYVKKEDFERSIQRLFDKLDHIEMKIDRKADK